MHTGVTHVHISYTPSGPQTHQTPHWECPCSGGDIYQTVTVGWWSVGILPELENVFMEDVMVISIIHHLSLLCPSGSEHKHHESQHQTLHSSWGAQTRRNQASWLIVDYIPRNTLRIHCICYSLHVFFMRLSMSSPTYPCTG